MWLLIRALSENTPAGEPGTKFRIYEFPVAFAPNWLLEFPYTLLSGFDHNLFASRIKNRARNTAAGKIAQIKDTQIFDFRRVLSSSTDI
jgi:hypothetical protein